MDATTHQTKITSLGTANADVLHSLGSNEYTRPHPHGHFGEPSLDTALALTTLVHLGYEGKEVASGIAYLTGTQRATGEWSQGGYYSGPNKRFYFGSQELTSAFCVEALAVYRRRTYLKIPRYFDGHKAVDRDF